ncbi:DUF4231 domain-containing protein [Micromonospora tulbaghiae]
MNLTGRMPGLASGGTARGVDLAYHVAASHDGIGDKVATGTEAKDPDIQIADLEGRIQESCFYLKIITAWTLVSIVLAASFAVVLIAGFKSFPREAQYWCLAIAMLSVLVSSVVMHSQKSKLFQVERTLRQWRALRRSRARGARGDEGYQANRERYRSEVWEYVEEARKNAGRNRRIHNLFQAAIILGSILVTSLTSVMASESPLNWVTVVMSIVVTASAGLSSYFKFRERGFNLQQTANAIEKEYNAAELRIHDYAEDVEDDEAMRIFAERVEALKEEQRARELQLEQSPERATTYGSSPNGGMPIAG